MDKPKHSSGPWHRGYMAALQDFCENCHFASAGGKDKRANKGEKFEAPDYIPEEHRKDYLAGYRDYCQEAWGDDWDICEMGWQPVLTIGEKGPENEPKVLNNIEEAREAFGGKMSLDEAIEHFRDVAQEDLEPCVLSHDQLGDWLVELKALRRQNKTLVEKLESVRKEWRKFQRSSGVSMDDDVHIKLSISQFTKTWMNSRIISRYVMKRFGLGEQTLLHEEGKRLLEETIAGFLVERERRGFGE